MFEARNIPYERTNSFSKIVIDYLKESKELESFYSYSVSIENILKAIENKRKQNINRSLLVEVLDSQYSEIEKTDIVNKNIKSLLSENTFTICTAHQPNLLTGPIYFIYKILHVIKLAHFFKVKFPEFDFVPIYYMGSEDADFNELNHFTIGTKTYSWTTDQKGAVGRMVIDDKFVAIIEEIYHQISNEKSGETIFELVKECFIKGRSIQEATFHFVQNLFNDFGLLILIADEVRLKTIMKPVFYEDIFQHKASQIVSESSAQLNENYKVQAYPRKINLFYLTENVRNRIEIKDNQYTVIDTDLTFTPDQLYKELENHPERFSPNVILRGLYQETILPNICFVGGGGELAYWLQLKGLFMNYHVAYPMLILRNSFLIIDNKAFKNLQLLNLSAEELFLTENDIMKILIDRVSDKSISLNGNLEKASLFYDQVKSIAGNIDSTLSQHVEAIKVKSMRFLKELEKKMYRAQKRKFYSQQSKIQKIKEILFPDGNLQERSENVIGFYSKYGNEFIKELYQHSLCLEQEFTILVEK